MAKVTIDENGNVVDFLAERNEEIVAALEQKMQILLEEKGADRKGTKRLGFRMMMQINGALNKYPRMSAERFSNLDADDMEALWNGYYDLMCYYNLYFEIVPNRQGFLKYSGLNARQYQQLQDSSQEEMRSVMIFIEDSLKQDGFSAGENGNADAKAIGTRLAAKSDGHNMVSAGDEMLAEKVAEAATPFELQQKMKAILGQGDTKYLK